MTKLGLYLEEKSVNKSAVARKTGLSKARISELTRNPSTRLQADELYLIALAISVEPCEMLKELCKDLELVKNPESGAQHQDES